MNKKKHKKNQKSFVSQKRTKEIENTFKTLGLINNSPYQGAQELSKNFQRVSLYESSGVIYTTSSSSNR